MPVFTLQVLIGGMLSRDNRVIMCKVSDFSLLLLKASSRVLSVAMLILTEHDLPSRFYRLDFPKSTTIDLIGGRVRFFVINLFSQIFPLNLYLTKKIHYNLNFKLAIENNKVQFEIRKCIVEY